MVEQFLTTITNAHTKDAYARDVSRFVEWLGEDSLPGLLPQDLLNYIAHLQAEGTAASSVNRQLSSVRSFLRWAALTGRVPPAVYATAQVVSGVKAAKNLPRPLTPAQVDLLLDQPDISTAGGARDLAFIKLALATGARLDELVCLDVEQLDFDRRRIIVAGKGSKERAVLFTQDAASALVYYLGTRGYPQDGPLFVNQCGERLSRRWFQRALAGYGDAAGIAGLHPHQLRHSFATELLDRTGDLDAVSKLLGHARLDTTRIYTGLATGRLERIYREAMEDTDDRSRVHTQRHYITEPILVESEHSAGSGTNRRVLALETTTGR